MRKTLLKHYLQIYGGAALSWLGVFLGAVMRIMIHRPPDGALILGIVLSIGNTIMAYKWVRPAVERSVKLRWLLQLIPQQSAGSYPRTKV